jgi:hypothetical protein
MSRRPIPKTHHDAHLPGLRPQQGLPLTLAPGVKRDVADRMRGAMRGAGDGLWGEHNPHFGKQKTGDARW